MPPKRKRAATTAAAGGNSGSGKNKEESKEEELFEKRVKELESSLLNDSEGKSFINTLIKQLCVISNDKKRSVDALQSLIDCNQFHILVDVLLKSNENDDTDIFHDIRKNNAIRSTWSKDNIDCYYIILATHTIHTLTRRLNHFDEDDPNENENHLPSSKRKASAAGKKKRIDENADNKTTEDLLTTKLKLAIIISVLGYNLSKVLMSDRTKLERCGSIPSSSATTATITIGGVSNFPVPEEALSSPPTATAAGSSPRSSSGSKKKKSKTSSSKTDVPTSSSVNTTINLSKLVRSIIGKAIVCVTVGSTSSIQELISYVNNSMKKGDDEELPYASLIKQSIWSSLHSLELILVQLNSSKSQLLKQTQLLNDKLYSLAHQRILNDDSSSSAANGNNDNCSNTLLARIGDEISSLIFFKFQSIEGPLLKLLVRSDSNDKTVMVDTSNNNGDGDKKLPAGTSISTSSRTTKKKSSPKTTRSSTRRGGRSSTATVSSPSNVAAVTDGDGNRNSHSNDDNTGSDDSKEVTTLLIRKYLGLLVNTHPLNRLILFDGVRSAVPPIKRWSCMVFVWLCQGQLRLLNAVLSMLDDKNKTGIWTNILHYPHKQITALPIDSTTKKQHQQDEKKNKKKSSSGSKSKKKRATSTAAAGSAGDGDLTVASAALSSPSICLMGDVALVTLCCRAIDLISSECISTSCGKSPSQILSWSISSSASSSNNGIDTYASAILPKSIFGPSPLDDLLLFYGACSSDNEESGGQTKLASATKRGRVSSPKASTRGGSNSNSTKNNKVWVRYDLCNSASTILYYLIDLHKDCIENNTDNKVMPRRSSSYLLVNDDNAAVLGEGRGEMSIPYYPFVNKTIDALCKAAAETTSSSDVTDIKRILDCIGSAFIVKAIPSRAIQNEENIVTADAKLCSYAVSKLSDTLRNILNKENSSLVGGSSNYTITSSSSGNANSSAMDTDTPSTKTDNEIALFENAAQKFKLHEILPVPSIDPDTGASTTTDSSTSIGTKGRKKKTASVEDSCSNRSDKIENSSSTRTFGGLFPLSQSPLSSPSEDESGRRNDGELLSLFFRGAMEQQQTRPREEPGHDLLLKLLTIVRCCYEVPYDGMDTDFILPKINLNLEGVIGDDANSSSTRKRSATTSTENSKRKKRNTGAGQNESASVTATKNSDECNKQTDFLTPRERMNNTRTGLATDTLTALKMCLQHPPRNRNSSPSSSLPKVESYHLRLSLRRSFTTDLACDLVDLGRLLNLILIEPHHSRIKQNSAMDGKDSGDRKIGKTTGKKHNSSLFFASSGGGIGASTRNGYTHSERSLWTSHINLCLVVARGQTSFDPRKLSTAVGPILGNAEQRLRIFRAVGRYSRNIEGEGTTEERWPLYLPSIHHALITSNITNEPVPSNNDEAKPEKFIADAFLQSLSSALNDLQHSVAGTTHNGSPMNTATYEDDSDKSRSTLTQEERRSQHPTYVPLSLRDGRLFLLAVSRLPREEQLECLSAFVEELHSSVSKIKSDDSSVSLVARDSGVSGFLARTITICVTLLNIVMVGPQLRETLCLQVGPSQYGLPNDDYDEDCDSDADDINKDWYTSEKCFMGVFGDWESPTIPDVNLREVTAFSPISISISSKLGEVLEMTLKLGFSSACNDKGHLLFASWNASGKRRSWDKRKNQNAPFSSDMPMNRYPQALMELRDDICQIHREIHGTANVVQDSLLSRLLKDGTRNKLGFISKTKETLREMLRKAEILVDCIVIGEKAGPPSSSLVSFALFETLPVYLAYIVAAHTIPKDSTTFSYSKSPKRRRKNKRGISLDDNDEYGDSSGVDLILRAQAGSNSDNSSESDGGYDFEDADDDDERIDAIMHLHDAVSVFGAAPTYPDWLDINCQLQSIVTPEYAIDVSQRALQCLNRLISCASKCYTKSIQEAFATCVNPEASKNDLSAPDKHRAMLAFHLNAACSADASIETMAENTGEHSNTEEWQRYAADICKLSPSAFDPIMTESNSKNVLSAREAWCENSAQQIFGGLQDKTIAIDGWNVSQAELRASGEWEILLSDTLLGSCLDLDVNESSVTREAERKATRSPRSSKGVLLQRLDKARAAFIVSKRWRRVLEASVTNLMPVVALLRLGLARGTGRAVHPLNKREIDPKNAEELSFSENISNQQTVAQSTKALVQSTLARLSEVSSACKEKSMLKLSCHAVAAQLLVQSKAFADLEGIHRLKTAFMGLSGILAALKNERGRSKHSSAVPYMARKLVTAVESQAHSTNFALSKQTTSMTVPQTKNADRLDFVRMLAHFGHSSILSFNLVVDRNVNHARLLADINSDAVKNEIYIFDMVSLLCQSTFEVDIDTRNRLGRILSGAVEQEYCFLQSSPDAGEQQAIILPSIVKAFNRVGNAQLLKLVKDDICLLNSPSDQTPQSEHMLRNSKTLCVLFAFVLNVEGVEFGGSKLFLSTLLNMFDDFEAMPSLVAEYVLDLLFLLGCRFDALKDIGKKLVSCLVSVGLPDQEAAAKLVTLERFFHYISCVDAALGASASNNPTRQSRPFSTVFNENVSDAAVRKVQTETNVPDSSEEGSSTSGAKACSFVLRSGDFHEQHWYNCFDCGLLDDKGACSLCARVCHKNEGHEVGYSRYSSFFCDCGAESSSARDRGRSPCKCLTAVSPSGLNDEPSDGFLPLGKQISSDSNKSKDEEHKEADTERSTIDPRIVELAMGTFVSQTKSSIDSFKESARTGYWIESLFDICGSQYSRWKDEQLDFSMPSQETAKSGVSIPRATDILDLQQQLRNSLRSRCGKALDLQQRQGKTLVPVRATKSNSFKLNLSSDSTTDRLKRAMLAKNEIGRVAMQATSRGVFIIAEPCSLLFCSALPAINVRYKDNSVDAPLSRAQMSILGSSSVKFNIVGMQLCRENERHLVVWGSSEACVVVLSESCDSVRQTINLVFDLEPHECEAEYLLKCEWIPGSQRLISVACGPFVKIYDINRIESESKSHCTMSFCLAYEAMLRDIAFVPLGSTNRSAGRLKSGSLSGHGKEGAVKVFLLLDSGRLHSVDLSIDHNGELMEQGERYLESGESISLPTAGIRIYNGAPLGVPDSTSRSLGEGSDLIYLKQSGILLYKCKSSCVLALMVDKEGKICGSFELLPQNISSDVLGETHSIFGPFSQWTDLGIIEQEGHSYFRIACVGKSSKNSQPKILCVEFNEHTTRVKGLNWSAGVSMGVSLSLSSSFDGVASFSAPELISGANENPVADDIELFEERLFLAAITSNGAMLIFGEESQKKPPSSGLIGRREFLSNPLSGSTTAEKAKHPVFPLTLFEMLKNVSDSDELTIGGDGAGSDPKSMKKKLSPTSSSFMMSPSVNGCTLTISLKPREEQHKAAPLSRPKIDKGKDKQSQGAKRQLDHGNLVIAALRVQVGNSSTEYIPKHLILEGRLIELKHGKKRWYDLPLTKEEVLFVVRNGFLSLGIGPSFDLGSPALIDSIEVYAIERKDINRFIPKRLKCNPSTSVHRESTGDEKNETDELGLEKELNLSIGAVTHLCKVLGVDCSAKNISHTLQQLVQATATEHKKKGHLRVITIDLLKTVMPESSSRQLFLDEATVFGLSRSLSSAKARFDKAIGGEDVAQDSSKQQSSLLSAWTHVRQVLEDCLTSASRIAKDHPENYFQANKKMMLEGISAFSLSVGAYNLFERGMSYNMDCSDLVAALVDLCMSEAFCSQKLEDGNFAGLNLVAKTLTSPDLQIVENCCDAIASYVHDISVADAAKESEDSHHDPSTGHPIAYQCDSCSLFPIKDSRYTLLEGGHYDIDLCKSCYRIGQEYAALTGYNSGADVIINGKTLGLDAKTNLSCAQIKQMQPVPIATDIIDQVEQDQLVKASNSQAAEDDDAVSLQKALRMSLGENVDDFSEQLSKDEQRLKHEKFTMKIFDKIITSLLAADNAETILRHPSPIFQLILGIIFSSKSQDVQLAKQFARHTSRRISQLTTEIVGSSGADNSTHQKSTILVMYLRSLSNLLTRKGDVSAAATSVATGSTDRNAETPVTHRTKEKTDPRFVCDAHGVPAVRRRCSTGIHKNRRFYVCGMSRQMRCRYFKWADEPETEAPAPVKSSYYIEMERFLWELLEKKWDDCLPALHVQLCDFLEKSFETNAALPYEVTSSTADTRSGEGRGSEHALTSLYGRREALVDLEDGVFCSQEKLRCTSSRFLTYDNASNSHCSHSSIGESLATENVSSAVMRASMELLALVASNSTQINKENDSVSGWYAVLCEIISSSSAGNFRPLAKRCLKRLCGGKKAVYHSVRDHYVFGFQFRNLLLHCQGALDASLVVREQARLCGSGWKTGEAVRWANLQAGGLLGTQDLISEDAVTIESVQKISSILDELMNVAKSRGCNWRHFCGNNSCLPRAQRKKKAGGDGHISEELLEAFNRSPMILLMWVACSLSGPNQVKTLELIDVALTTEQDGNSKSRPITELDIEDDSSDGGMDADMVTPGNKPSTVITQGKPIIPDEALLAAPWGFSFDEVHAFIVQFVYRGPTAQLRKVACRVACHLCRKMPTEDLNNLLGRLMDGPFSEIGIQGRASTEFLDMLRGVVRDCLMSSESIKLSNAAKVAIECFVKQMRAMHDGPNDGMNERVVLEIIDEGVTAKKRFDLSNCVHCHREISLNQKPVSKEPRVLSRGRIAASTGQSNEGETSTGSSLPRNQTSNQSPWLIDQVRPFVRGRLEASTESSVSTEFATYVQLKFRLAISDIHLTVNDARGRYAKKIGVYFTPRQVSDASTLKSEEYSTLWQRCATLTLSSRGASRASCKLAVPVVAANLKFEYLDFYEKPGGTRSADGTLILHCPRCTRIVNNAHGVCGHCGEVVFQCRKCRHINYDRLDAFLCVECGYCSSGGFAYELTAGIASNAVAIMDEDGFNRAVKILRIATKLHEDLQNTLRKKVRNEVSKGSKKRPRDMLEDFDTLAGHGSHALRRAFLGELPKPGGGGGPGGGSGGGGSSGGGSRKSSRKTSDRGSSSSSDNFRGSAVASIAASRPRGDDGRSSAASKARNVLRLVQQRGPSGSSGRNRSGLRILSIDDLDNDDVLGMINSSDGIVLDSSSSDSLSRLVASIQGNRAEGRSSSSGGRGDDATRPSGGGGGGGGGSGSGGEGGGSGGRGSDNKSNNDSSSKSVSGELERVYQLMREAERERYELQRRINAWNRLENDALADLGLPTIQPPAATISQFTPTLCSVCNGSVTVNLLRLIYDMLCYGTNQIGDCISEIITKEFIRALFDESIPEMNPTLFELKRSTISILATTPTIQPVAPASSTASSSKKSPSRLILSELQTRLRSIRDVQSAEILGKILEDHSDFELVNEYVSLAMETLSTLPHTE